MDIITTSIINKLKKQFVNTDVIVTDRLLISDNRAELPYEAKGEIKDGFALIFDDETTMVCREFTCNVSEDKKYVEFDPEDELNTYYCVVTYVGITL